MAGKQLKYDSDARQAILPDQLESLVPRLHAIHAALGPSVVSP